MPKQIGVVVGSLRKESINRKLAQALIKLGPPDFTFKDLRIGDLPLYNQDDDKSQAPEVQRLLDERLLEETDERPAAEDDDAKSADEGDN